VEFRSNQPELEVPSISLTEYVLGRVQRLGGKPAFIDGVSGRVIQYAQLNERISRVAGGLANLGFGRGDVLAIYSPNLPEYLIAFHAAATLGGIITTVNPLFRETELAKQLRDSGARFLLTTPMLAAKARAAALAARIEHFIVFGEESGAISFDSLMEDELPAPEATFDPGQTVVLPYSSGTTGLPKGVMLSHHNLVANVAQLAAIDSPLMMNENDTCLAVLPFFHIYGMLMFLAAAPYFGCTVVTLPRFDLETWLETAQKYDVSYAHLVPPIILALAKHPLVDNYKLKKLRAILSGAAPLSEDVAKACSERLGCEVAQGYGLTETSPVVLFDSGVVQPRKLGSVGQLIPGTKARIVDVVSGDDLGPGEQGELLIRGPQVMKGYLNNPDATEDCLSRDRWLRTGDIASVDEDGCFYIVDRVKELIKYKGYQVAPAELEAVLLKHPQISDAAVIPVPDKEAGEIPKAFVVAVKLTEDQVIGYVASQVAPYKKIRAVEFIDEIPKSPTGKILRRVLIEKERAAAR